MLYWSVNGFSGSKAMGPSTGNDYVGILGKFYTDNPNAVPGRLDPNDHRDRSGDR